MFCFLSNSRNLSIVQSIMNSNKFLSIQNHDILGTGLTELSRSSGIKWFTGLECYSEVITTFL